MKKTIAMVAIFLMGFATVFSSLVLLGELTFLVCYIFNAPIHHAVPSDALDNTIYTLWAIGTIVSCGIILTKNSSKLEDWLNDIE